MVMFERELQSPMVWIAADASAIASPAAGLKIAIG